MVMEIIISLVLLFIGIAALVAIHVCIVGRAFRAGQENGHDMTLSRSSNRAKMLTNEDLKSLPCFDCKAAAEKGGTSSVDCVVCLEQFKVGENCRLLPNCNHSFHAQCIDSWLLKTPFCPICRSSVNPMKTHKILSEESHVSVGVEVELT